jgi:hypothetical protein
LRYFLGKTVGRTFARKFLDYRSLKAQLLAVRALFDDTERLRLSRSIKSCAALRGWLGRLAPVLAALHLIA